MASYNLKKKKWIAAVKKTLNGRQYRKQKLFLKEKDAHHFEVQWKNATADEWKAESQTRIICLHDWATEYLSYSETKHDKSKTYSEKRAAFKRLLEMYDPNLPLEHMSLGKSLKYFQKQEKNRSGNAANRDRKNFIAAWNWGKKYIDVFPQHIANPFLTDKMAEKRYPRYIPPLKDFWAVFNQAQGQDYIMLLCYLHTAARPGELFRLKWQDVDFDNAVIRLYTKKTKDGDVREDQLPMSQTLYDLLLQHKETAVNAWVFPNHTSGLPYIDRRTWRKKERWSWMKGLCEKACVRYFHLYAIRHLTPSILSELGAAPKTIQAVMRHTNFRTTEKYLHQMSDTRSALQLLPGGKGTSQGTSSTPEKIKELTVNG